MGKSKFSTTGNFAWSVLLLFILTSQARAQLTINPNQTAAILSAKLAGPGITILSPVLTCAKVANGLFVSTTTPITIDSGIVLTTGTATQAIGPESTLASTSLGTPGDPSLGALAMATTYDACALEFDFVAKGDSVSFNYQFGSEEYNHSTCGPYNDAFAFFISGPGISGIQNMALVPGTNIPVTVNSVNSGVPGLGYSLANCTAMGSGSPFPAYFYDNTGGTQVTYKGYTVKLAAVHSVTPCDTYHLKIAVCDAGNRIYDSGVFIEAGSLKSNSISFNHTDSMGATIAGIAHTIVRGCSPATIKVMSARPTTKAQVVHFTFGGSAIQGVDFVAPDSAIITTGTDSVLFTVAALAGSTGAKKVTIYLSSPFTCGVADSVTINIIDTPLATILTPDTTICPGNSFLIRATGTPGLSYSWLPAASLSSASVMQPIATPPTTTTYVMTATLPRSGCPTITRNMTVTMVNIGAKIETPDTVICFGSTVNIMVSGSPAYTYQWLPMTNINNPSLQDPTATPIANTVYSLVVTSSTCSYSSQINITVLKPEAAILTPDTSTCLNLPINIEVSGDASLRYSWSPGAGLNDPGIMLPAATPKIATTYTMTASETTPGGAVCAISKTITITPIPPPAVDAGPDVQVCVGLPFTLSATPFHGHYSYQWEGPAAFSSGNQEVTVDKSLLVSKGVYTVTVVDLNSGCTGRDTTMVGVYNNTAALTEVTADQTIEYGDHIQLNAENDLHYLWTPDDGSLNNPNINDPIATPERTTTYVVYGTDIHGCRDSAAVTITLNYENIKIPDAFSPNGDGLNDYFHIHNLGFFKLVSLSIYNRWGNLLYYTQDQNTRGWDGKFNGVPQDIDTYGYYIITSTPQGALQYYKGNLTLVR